MSDIISIEFEQFLEQYYELIKKIDPTIDVTKLRHERERFKKDYNLYPTYQILQINGFNCMIKRHKIYFHLCGYIYITATKYLDKLDNLTNLNRSFTLRFTEDFVIIGFDFMHSGDYIPNSLFNYHDCTYKDVKFVGRELGKIIDIFNGNEVSGMEGDVLEDLIPPLPE